MPWIAVLLPWRPVHPRMFLDFLISLLYHPLSSDVYSVSHSPATSLYNRRYWHNFKWNDTVYVNPTITIDANHKNKTMLSGPGVCTLGTCCFICTCLSDCLILINVIHVVLNEGQDSSLDVQYLVIFWFCQTKFLYVAILEGGGKWTAFKHRDEIRGHRLHCGRLGIMFRHFNVTQLNK